MEPTKRVMDLITISERLADVLEQENDLLRDRRQNELSSLLDEKVTLSRVYESRVLGLMEAEEGIESVDDELRDELREMAEYIEELMEENTTLLKIAIEANKRIVDFIADVVREAAPTAGTYAPNGTKTPAGVAAAQSVSLSLDQTL